MNDGTSGWIGPGILIAGVVLLTYGVYLVKTAARHGNSDSTTAIVTAVFGGCVTFMGGLVSLVDLAVRGTVWPILMIAAAIVISGVVAAERSVRR